MTLARYQQKRDFARTPEPRGAPVRPGRALRFVIQKHDATRLHYDFRLELDGVLKSWAVPKGPSLDPGDRRLAVHVEDHPVAYGSFEGVIPAGEYGGGSVVLWDRGTWIPEGDPAAGYAKGHLRFCLEGEKVRGDYSLVRMHGHRGGDEKHDNWLLIKGDDEHASADGEALVRDRPESVTSGRVNAEVAAAADLTWTRAGAKKTARERTGAAKTAAKAKGTSKVAKVKATKVKRTKAGASKATKARAKRTGKLAKARVGSADEPAPARLGDASLPDRVAPELATLVDAVPRGEGWLHEVKFDGYRLIARLDGGECTLWTRNGLDWSARFPWLVAALAERLGPETAILDGELVHLGADGVSRFGALQAALAAERSAGLVYVVFDLLHLRGVDLRGLPLERRKQALVELLPEEARPGRVRYSQHIVGQGEPLFTRACGLGLEGVVSKRRDAAYHSGRHRDWLKVKCGRRQEVVVGGFTAARSGGRAIGALLVGVYDDTGGFHYGGKVGSGLDERGAAAMLARLEPLVIARRAFIEVPPEAGRASFVRPEVVVEVSFSDWTADGRMRHPVFVAVREDRRPRDIRREQVVPVEQVEARASAPVRAAAMRARPAKAAARGPAGRGAAEIEVAGVPISHPDRVLYPAEGIAKRAVAQYYADVARWMLPWVVGRPVSVVRCPEDIKHPCFFQKHLHSSPPAGVGLVVLDEGAQPFVVIEDERGLVGLAQAGMLELHVWGSTARRPDAPDRVVFDLDPDPAVPWARVKETAAAVRARLEALELESYLKTTGGKGLHVVVPLAAGKQDWAQVKAFSHAVALEFVDAAPELFIATASKAGRRGKIFLDYLRNGRGATSVAPYSLRARPGAPASVPIRWDELARLPGSDKYTLANLAARLRRMRADPWQDMVEPTRQFLRAAVLRAVGVKRGAK